MSPNAETLNAGWIERLNADTSPWMRAQVAATVAVLFVEGALDARERRYAIAILEHLARDLEQRVREALSEHVKHCALLPHSIARTLAKDVESVAVPIIRYSSVLEEADLLAIAHGGSEAKQIALAQRENLAAVVSHALVESEIESVVGVLLANETARIDEASYLKILEGFGRNETIQALMAERPGLPASIVARLLTRVGDGLREGLIERFELPETIAGDLTARARERALSESFGQIATPETLEAVARRLLEEGSLTPIFLLRALCTGQLRLFTAGVAARAGISVGNADELMRDGGRQGFMALYLHAGLPGDLMSAFRIALDVVLEAEAAGPAPWSEAVTQRIIGCLVVAYDGLAPGHLESVLAQLARQGAKCRQQPVSPPALSPAGPRAVS